MRGLFEGMRSIGADGQTIGIFEDLVDAKRSRSPAVISMTIDWKRIFAFGYISRP
jgi:hypothetical protein